jgi:hypothetical protein
VLNEVAGSNPAYDKVLKICGYSRNKVFEKSRGKSRGKVAAQEKKFCRKLQFLL